MKKCLKIVFTILILVSIFYIVPQPSLAADNFDTSRFEGKENETVNNAAKSVVGTAVSVIRIVGTAIAIIALTYLGMRYMMASPDGKAEFKKSAYIYIVGAIMVFAASNILSIIYNFAENL